MGVVILTPDIRKLIESLNLTVVAKLPARSVTFNQHPGAKRPQKSGTIAQEVAIVLAVSEEAKTVSRKELLRAVNCLKQWCK